MSALFRPRGPAIATFRTPPECYHGDDASLVFRTLAAARVAVVMSRSVVGSAPAARIVERLRGTAFEVLEPSWAGEPELGALVGTVGDLERLAPDVIVAVGGGAVIDGAKLAWLRYALPDIDLADGGPVRWSSSPRGRARFVAVPTTAGSGSEVSSAAVVMAGGSKLPIVSDELIPDAVVLVPEFLVGLPDRAFGASLLDALSHVVEGYVSTVSNPLMDVLGEGALRVVASEWRPAVEQRAAPSLRRLQYAAMEAGWIQNHCLVGASHALAHHLGDVHPHGEANAILLPGVISHNSTRSPAVATRYAALASAAGIPGGHDGIGALVDEIAAATGVPRRLDPGVADRVGGLVEAAAADPAARTNPVAADAQFLTGVVRTCLDVHR